MKLHTATFFGTLSVLASLIAVSSCSKTEVLTGAWEGTSMRISNIKEASDASAVITMDFSPIQSGQKSGEVNLSAVISIAQATDNNLTGNLDVPYQANIAATASISGIYLSDEDDKDDYILHLDPSTLTVDIDPSGVTYSSNLMSGMEQPVLDSLTSRTVDTWRVIVTSAIRDEFNKYRYIDDVKIHHKDILSAEIGDRDCTFRRVGSGANL